MPRTSLLASEPPDHREDLELARAIRSGCEESWHEFMNRYADLVSNVAGRFLFSEDEVAAVQAKVFDTLHQGKLEAYHGRSSLAAWIAVLTRNITADTLRERFGRREDPVGLRRLSTHHREVFRLYFVDGKTFPATLETLRQSDPNLNEGHLLSILQDIHDRVTDKTLRRVAYDLAAHSVGAASGRLLEYFQMTTWDTEDKSRNPDPLAILMRRQAEARARKILELVAELPEEDRKVLSLRFDKGMRAKEIARILGYSGQRRVFTVIDRIIGKLRRKGSHHFDEIL